jgi:hypothetical protein
MDYAEFHTAAVAVLRREGRPMTVREIVGIVYEEAGCPEPWEWVAVDPGPSLAQHFRADPARFAYDRATKRWWPRWPAPPPDHGAAMLRATGYGEARGPF